MGSLPPMMWNLATPDIEGFFDTEAFDFFDIE
jgi:hypothetical protein